MPLAEAIERLDRPTRDIIGLWQDEQYQPRTRYRSVLSWYETSVLESLQTLPPATSYQEIGGGIGLISVALGLMGSRSVNIDSTASRIAQGQAIIDALAKDDPSLKDRVQMISGLAPIAFKGLDTKGAYAICTNVVGARSWEFIDGIIRAIRSRYAALIFDVCLFWGDFRADWPSHLAKVEASWGSTAVPLFNKDEYARYYVLWANREEDMSHADKLSSAREDVAFWEKAREEPAWWLKIKEHEVVEARARLAKLEVEG